LLCRTTTAVRLDGNYLTAIPLRCKSWPCPNCGPKRRSKLIAQILSGSPTTFLTLTWKPRDKFTPAQAAHLMSSKFACLAKRIRRHFPEAPFEYALVWEATKAGWPHMHVVCRAPYIPQRWLSDRWREMLGSPIVDIRAIKDPSVAARYVSKYVAKAPHQFAGTKRYRFSQHYRPTETDRPEEMLPPESGWAYIRATIEQLSSDLHTIAIQESDPAYPDLFSGPLMEASISALDRLQMNSPARLDGAIQLLTSAATKNPGLPHPLPRGPSRPNQPWIYAPTSEWPKPLPPTPAPIP